MDLKVYDLRNQAERQAESNQDYQISPEKILEIFHARWNHDIALEILTKSTSMFRQYQEVGILLIMMKLNIQRAMDFKTSSKTNN